jgi:hypothetical protein
VPTPTPPPPYNLADALPSVRTIQATYSYVRWHVDVTNFRDYVRRFNSAHPLFDGVTDAAFWVPLLSFNVGDEFPDGAVLTSSIITTGPTDPDQESAIGTGVWDIDTFGDYAGREAAVVLSVNGPIKHKFEPGQVATTSIIPKTPWPVAGMRSGNASNVGAAGSILGYWRFCSPLQPGGDVERLLPRSRQSTKYAPAGVRLHPSDMLSVAVLVPLSAFGANYKWAMLIDVRLSFLIRGDASIYTRG